MRPSPLLTLLAALAASTAFAQDGAPSLEGEGRISIQGGWRYVSNSTFYNGYYSQHPEFERAPQSHVVGSFAYAVTDLVEVGIDLFGTAERMQLTGTPELTVVNYGALLGLRFQGWLNLGPEGTVPFLGLLTGPMLASSTFKGQPVRELLSQAWAGSAGATMRLTPRWGITAEYRLVFARGAVGKPEERFGTFNAGGSWLSVGVNYSFPPEPGPSRAPF
jgi:opacity protein-like surface antigen